jgi:hypothetical protein
MGGGLTGAETSVSHHSQPTFSEECALARSLQADFSVAAIQVFLKFIARRDAYQNPAHSLPGPIGEALKEELPTMRSRAFRPIATILSLLLMAAVPVHASPLTFADVVHVMGNMQNGGQNPQLRLRTVQQQGTTPTSGTNTTTTQTPSSGGTTTSGGNRNTNTAGGTEPSSLIQGTQTPTTQTPKVEVVQQGDIEGTICDCGEVRLPAGHFPWWWLAGIPAVCLTGICTKDKPKCEGPGCTVTQCIPKAGEDANCQTTTIPEPASLLLFGSGLAALGAGARRRYQRIKLTKQESVATEV